MDKYITQGLKEDIKEIKGDIKLNSVNISKIFTAQAQINQRLQDHVENINEKLNGNGQDGLIKSVKKLQVAESERVGRNKLFMAAVGSGWLVTIFMLIFQLLRDGVIHKP